MANKEITLYDIKSTYGVTASPNVWKTRASLNFKGLPFKTEWLNLEDIEPFLKSQNVEANPEGSLIAYTLPAIRMPNGTLIMESLSIARVLDELQPEPSLHCEGPCDSTAATCQNIAMALYPVFAQTALQILPPTTRAYFIQRREKWFGKPWDEWLEESSQDLEGVWARAQVPVDELKQILATDPSGPYVLGRVPSFSDFAIGGLWKAFELVSQPMLERLLGMDERFPCHLEACREWLKTEA